MTVKSRKTADLYDEVHNCVICGRPIRGKNENEIWVKNYPDEKRNLFVEPGCMNLLRKFETVYGKEFYVPESSGLVTVAAQSTLIQNIS